MKYNKAVRGLLILFLVNLSFFGCVRIKVPSSELQTLPQPPTMNSCKLDSFDVQEEVIHEVSITRHESANITSNEIKEILKNSTDVAQKGNNNQGKPGDAACKITFAAKIDPSENPSNNITSILGNPSNPLPSGDPLDCIGNGEICSEFDFYAVASHDPSDFKVVKDIRWCAFPRSGVDGCTDKHLSILVRRMCESHGRCPELEGISWLHEFGHIQGLYHRSNDSEPAVMKDTFTTHDIWLNPCECLKYRKSRKLL